MRCRCLNCETLASVWSELAETLNEIEDEPIAIAKVDCSIDKDLCTGRDSYKFSR